MITKFPFSYKLNTGELVTVTKAGDEEYDFTIKNLDGTEEKFSSTEPTSNSETDGKVDSNITLAIAAFHGMNR